MTSRSLRVATLNCWNVSEPFDQRMALVRRGLEELQADVIGLQEIVVRRDGFDQGALILTDLGYQWAFGPAFRWDESGTLFPHDRGGDAFGNLIASRWPIRKHEVCALPGEETGERRSALGALIETPSGLLSFVTTHLNWKFHHGYVRERQVVLLADFVQEWSQESALPPVLVGDLNAEPDSREIRFLSGLASIHGGSVYFQDAWRVAGDGGAGFTWDNRNRFAAFNYEPNRRIDYVLVGLAQSDSGRGWIESARLAFDQPEDGVFPSDHFGVVADVRI